MADADVDSYLSRYGQEFQRLSYESALAEWESNTRIVERDSTNSVRTRRANEALARFGFRLNRKPVTANAIDDSLRTSRRLPVRLAAWEASKEVGPVVKPGMLRLNDQLIRELRPLHRELHTWARYELAKRYGVPVPDQLPAHWLPNRWGQDWSSLVEVKGLDVNAALAPRSAEWVVRQSEDFYRSIGFDSLPSSFWEKSSLYQLPVDAPYKKNTHASAWHMDLDQDVRSLMSVEPNRDWYGTAHHELGHVYYYMSYSRPEVPVVLRQGANRAYHEGIGSMIGLASSQRRFLAGRKLVPPEAQVVPADRFNRKWWELARQYQGIVPPSPRGERWADGLTKTHVNDDPAQYYDYALSYALLFQLHDHIARQILHQNPHDTDYYGHREVGDFLKRLMAPGAPRPWREVLRETTGRELDGKAMVEYFQPLYIWLQQQNRGRRATLPDL